MSADPFAAKGYVYLGAGAGDLTDKPIFGFTALEDVVLTSITHPSASDGTKYNGDPTDLIGKTLPAGIFYPIPATAINFASGSALGWIA
jgi:hypothetical protein